MHQKNLRIKCIFLVLMMIFSQVIFISPVALADTANLAQGKSITANGYTQTYVSTNANDGNVNSYWEGAANAYPNTLTVDLGSTQAVNKVVLKLNPATIWAARTQTLSILGSTDNTIFNTILQSAIYTFDPTSSNIVTINFTSTNTRYVRLNFTANSGSTGAQVAEFEVYGATQTSQPDLTISALTFTPANPAGGQVVTFTATVKNQGTATTTAGLTNVVGFNIGSSKVTSSTTTSIAVGGTATVTGSWTAVAGTYSVSANADDTNVIAESNESNNSFTLGTQLIISGGGDTSTKYEGENSTLSGGAKINTDHTGYTGTGFVDGIQTSGSSQALFTVNAASAGYYDIDLRYANAYNGTPMTMSLYLNGSKLRQTSLPALADWNTWGDKVETLALKAGSNTIAYKYDSSDTGNINIDYITVATTTVSKADLIISDITWSPIAPIEGNPVTFSAVVKNQGNLAGAAGIVVFQVDGTQVATSVNNTANIAVGGTTTISASGTWSSVLGSHTIKAIADNANTTSEMDETNNNFTKSITVNPQPGIDLVVTDISWSPVTPTVGNVVTFSVIVKNQGTTATTAGTTIPVQFNVDGNNVETSSNYTSSITPGASVTVTANSGSWAAINGTHPVIATVDYNNTIAETNETNNVFNKTFSLGVYGANLPYAEVQAENSTYTGTLIDARKNRTYPSLANEAIGRQAVTLSGQGQYVEFTVPQNANSIVMRYSIPDNTAGTGIDATLALYINGVKQTDLPVTSRYGWIYGGYPFNNNPTDLRPHHFYDEVNRLVSQMPVGTKVKVQVDSGNTAPSYTIDLMDFEQVAAPTSQPSGSLSLTDYGADPSGIADSTIATQTAVNAASNQGKVLWVPQGIYKINTQILVNNVTIKGAGIWYSKFNFITQTGNNEGFYGNYAPNPSTNVHLSDFAIWGNVVTRNDNDQINGIGGALTNSTIDDLWIEHTKCGMWLDGPFDNLKITGCRIRNQNADGVNFHKGITNSSVTQCILRNTGDDGLAMWSDSNGNSIADANNTFSHNTVEIPVLANCIALYGGTNNTVTDNYVSDQQAEGGGIHVGNRFSPVTPVSGTINIARNKIVRCGSEDYYNGWNFGTGAIWFFALDNALDATINVDDNIILDSNYEAIHFIGSSVTNVTFNRDQIIGCGTYAIESRANGGSATFNNVTATYLGQGGYYSASPMTMVQGPGCTGWSSTPTFISPYPTPNYLDFSY